jgi:neutral/alkaline ceramidase-like enzyme
MKHALVFAALLLFATPVGADDLRAGTAKVDITPPVGYPMWGYAARRDSPSVGVTDPLFARAVVLATKSTKIAIVSLDLGRAPTRSSTAGIRKQVKAAGIDHIFLVASHTHHGPVLELDTWPDPKKPYTRDLEQKLGQAIVDAAKKMQPVRLGIAAKEVNLNRNRHSRRADKPVDRELIVVRLEDAQGKPLAHLVNFAAHPTMLPALERKFSPDYPGALAALVEKETGGACLFLQGAAGDLSPNPGDERGPRKFGEAVGREVLALAKEIKCTLDKDVALQVRERDFQFSKRIDLSNPLVRTALNLAFFKDLVDFYEREYRDGVRPHLTTALLASKIGIVGLSGEAFSGHAISLKKRARLDHLLFLGYCNDYHQYFPTIEATAEGGYGTGMEVSPVETGAGELIMNRALRDLYEMSGKLLK